MSLAEACLVMVVAAVVCVGMFLHERVLGPLWRAQPAIVVVATAKSAWEGREEWQPWQPATEAEVGLACTRPRCSR